MTYVSDNYTSYSAPSRLRGLERCPIAHTCDGTLELATTYENYEQFEDAYLPQLTNVLP